MSHTVLAGLAALLACLLLLFLAVSLWGVLRSAARPTRDDGDNAGWGADDWFVKF